LHGENTKVWCYLQGIFSVKEKALFLAGLGGGGIL